MYCFSYSSSEISSLAEAFLVAGLEPPFSTSATSPTITPDSSLKGDSTVTLVFRRFMVATLTLATVLFFLPFRSNLVTPIAKNFCKNNTFTVQ